MPQKLTACILSVVILLIRVPEVCAKDSETSVFVYNESMMTQWVNWYPSGLVFDSEVAELGRRFAREFNGTDIPHVVHDWVCENIYYDWDAFSEERYSALKAGDVLRERKAVCEGISNLTRELLLNADVPCIKVWGSAIEADSSWFDTTLDTSRVNHTWNEYYLDGAWHYLDCTMDMTNRYENGVFCKGEIQNEFFDPSPEFFAKTHKILYRGEDTPADLPSEWAKQELKQTMDQRLYPISCFSKYHEPATKEDFQQLFGFSYEREDSLTRAEAAELLLQDLTLEIEEMDYFDDLSDCDGIKRRCVNLAFGLGVMRGIGNRWFSPAAFLSREEAILVAARYHMVLGYSVKAEESNSLWTEVK